MVFDQGVRVECPERVSGTESKDLAVPYYVYILRNRNNLPYIGIAKSLKLRLQAHGTEKGAKFVRDYGGFRIVYFERYATQLEAIRRERQIKGWKRTKKEALIARDLERLKNT